MKTIFYHVTPTLDGDGNARHMAGKIENWPPNLPYQPDLRVKVDGAWWVIVRLSFVANNAAYVLVDRCDLPTDSAEQTIRELA